MKKNLNPLYEGKVGDELVNRVIHDLPKGKYAFFGPAGWAFKPENIRATLNNKNINGVKRLRDDLALRVKRLRSKGEKDVVNKALDKKFMYDPEFGGSIYTPQERLKKIIFSRINPA